MGSEVYQALKKALAGRSYTTNVGDEGGFAPSLSCNSDAVEVVLAAIEAAGYKPGEEWHIALDPAASELYDAESKQYVLTKRGEAPLRR